MGLPKKHREVEPHSKPQTTQAVSWSGMGPDSRAKIRNMTSVKVCKLPETRTSGKLWMAPASTKYVK